MDIDEINECREVIGLSPITKSYVEHGTDWLILKHQEAIDSKTLTHEFGEPPGSKLTMGDLLMHANDDERLARCAPRPRPTPTPMSREAGRKLWTFGLVITVGLFFSNMALAVNTTAVVPTMINVLYALVAVWLPLSYILISIWAAFHWKGFFGGGE